MTMSERFLTAALATIFALGAGTLLLLPPWIERRFPNLPIPIITGYTFTRLTGILDILLGLQMGAMLIVMLKS